MSNSVRTVLTFALLTGGYFGYTRGFALVVDRLKPTFQAPLEIPALSPSLSRSAREATELAQRVFGKDHWATHSDKRYYNVERGYWMYWDRFDRPADQEGRRIVFSPFAVIWKSKNDDSVKVLAGDRAIVDFDNPFDLLKPGPKPTLVYARIEGTKDYVFIQDDKGTPATADDMIVTMPYAEYFERDMEIRCDQGVHLIDRDVTVQGTGLVIALRPSEAGQGFPGAETVTLKRDVVIKAEDVGRTGILPGTAQPRQQVDTAGQAPPKTPVMLSCDGEMVLRLPRPSIPPRVGPPAPAPPTIAVFSRNVVVKRGAGLPDQINGDNLTAILVPAEKKAPPGPALPGASPNDEHGSLGGLTLYEARVEGHSVWLQSEAERLKVRGNELIYRKPGADLPEVSYFRADKGKKLYMERIEVDDSGALKSLMIVWAADATLRGNPAGQGGNTITARGPGWLEQRSGPNQPVERWAKWRDELIVDTAARPDPGSQVDSTDTSRTYITLQGDPMVDDPAQVTMAARDRMIVCLKPRSSPNRNPAPTNLASSSGSSNVRGSGYQVEWITAHGDVHMITPETTPEGTPSAEGRRTLNARDQLQVVFEYAPLPPPTATAPTNPTVRPASFVVPSQEENPPPAADDNSTASSGSSQPKEAQGLDVEADLVWAKVVAEGPDGLGLSSKPRAQGQSAGRDVRQVRLRGRVRVQQDPAEGQDQGIDLTAAAVDVENDGPGRLKLNAQGTSDLPARLVTPEMTVEGPKLGANQARHLAWVEGQGVLTMRSKGRTGLGAIALASDGKTSSEPLPDRPSVIRWKDRMTFHGTYPDDRGRPGPARAQFLGAVDARFGDDAVACEELEAVLDRPVSFDRPLPGSRLVSQASNRPADQEDRPEIRSVICRDGVRIASLVRDESGKVRERREVHGPVVTFDRPTGDFWVDDAGTVFITGLTEEGQGIPNAGLTGSITGGRSAKPAQTGNGKKLVQTRVDFRKGMDGQIGMDNSGNDNGYREATFNGDIRVLRAVVPDFKTRLDHDRPPTDFFAVDSDQLVLEQNPAIPATNQPERTVLKVYGDSTGRTTRDVIRGDSIVYDSMTGLIYVRGTQAPAVIQSQDAAGQPPSTATGKAFVFNPKTGQSRVLEPGAMQLFEPGSSHRIGPEAPNKPRPKEKVKRPQPRIPARGDIERRGFAGGQ